MELRSHTSTGSQHNHVAINEWKTCGQTKNTRQTRIHSTTMIYLFPPNFMAPCRHKLYVCSAKVQGSIPTPPKFNRVDIFPSRCNHTNPRNVIQTVIELYDEHKPRLFLLAAYYDHSSDCNKLLASYMPAFTWRGEIAIAEFGKRPQLLKRPQIPERLLRPLFARFMGFHLGVEMCGVLPAQRPAFLRSDISVKRRCRRVNGGVAMMPGTSAATAIVIND